MVDVPDCNTELVQLLLHADITKLQNLKYPKYAPLHDAIMEIPVAQILIAIYCLAHIKRAILDRNIHEIYAHTAGLNAALANVRFCTFLVTSQLVRQKPCNELGFKAHFINYVTGILEEHHFKSSGEFWTFLRKQAGKTSISIGKYHIQATETGVQYNEGAPPRIGSSSVLKSSILKYFREAYKKFI